MKFFIFLLIFHESCFSYPIQENSAHFKYEIFKPKRMEIKSYSRNDDVQIYLNPDKHTLSYTSYDLAPKLKRDDTKYAAGDDELECATPTSKRSIVHEDRVPAGGLQLVEVPIIQDNEDIKLSDVGMQRSGDKVADTLNFCKARVFKGKDADEEIKHLKPCESLKT